MAYVHGKLDLTFTRVAQRTVMRVNQQQPPLQVVRAFDLPDAASLVHLHTVSGGVLGADRLELALESGPEARVQITTTSAMRIYRSRENVSPAIQTNTIRLHEGSFLEYLPDMLIPFAGSQYQQYTKITLEKDAGLFWWEVVAPGREARGELFAYDLLELHTDIVAENRLILRERAHIEPRQHPLDSNTRLGKYRYMATFYICHAGRDSSQWMALESQLQQQAVERTQAGVILWGVSSLPAHGLVVRALSMRGRDIYSGLFTFWQMAKRTLFGREAILPRKIY